MWNTKSISQQESIIFQKYTTENISKTFGFSPISSTNSDSEIKTSNTIILILSDYFRQDDYIVRYVCDQSDSKQSFRNRLFNLRFNKYNDGNFEKIDLSFEQHTFVSAIIDKNNPFYIDFKQDFSNLGEKYK